MKLLGAKLTGTVRVDGEGRSPPELTPNGFVWFPLEVTFTPAETIDQIRVAGETH